jgi:hypothetical protein
VCLSNYFIYLFQNIYINIPFQHKICREIQREREREREREEWDGDDGSTTTHAMPWPWDYTSEKIGCCKSTGAAALLNRCLCIESRKYVYPL